MLRARARGPSTSSAQLATYLRYVDDSSRKLARSILEGAGRWEAELQQKQSFLARIVDIGTELFAIAAAVCYADTIGSDQPEHKTEAVELAELFCGQAKGRAETLFSALWSNRDDANYAAAQEVLAGRYTWLEDGITDPSGDGPMMPPLVAPAGTASPDAATTDRDTKLGFPTTTTTTGTTAARTAACLGSTPSFARVQSG